VALLLSYLGFVSLGLPDTVLGAAWPAIRADLGLPLDAAGLATMLTTAGIVVSSAGSARLRARLGTGAVLVASTALAAVALAVGAAAPRWAYLLGAAFLAGLGGGAIDASLNHLVARRYDARHINWLHACWGVGASLTPALVATLLARGASWRTPYAVLAVVEAALTFTFVASRRLWRDDGQAGTASRGRGTTRAVRAPMVASVLMFFCYGGVEGGTGLWATSLLTMTRGASPATAGALVSVYWGALTVGRFALGAAAEALGPARLLRAAVRSALVAAAAVAFPGTPIWFVGTTLALLGLSLAPVYPLAMHDTTTRFGEVGARLIGYQVAAAALGIAVGPWLAGVVGARTTPAAIPLVLLALALATAVLERARATVRP
jgi:fucose permease